ncbi:hypothetical protein ACFE04_020509 [Oxalis oulophora]
MFTNEADSNMFPNIHPLKEGPISGLGSQPGVVMFTNEISNQNIVLLDESESQVWSSNQTEAINNPVIQLLDSGNIVLRDIDNDDEYLWQSFDYPTDTLLPEMKLGWDFNRKFDRYITSWTSSDDPSTGVYAFKLDYRGMPEIFLWRKQVIVYRSGAWNGRRFSGVPEMKPVDNIDFSFVVDQDEVYYSFEIMSESLLSRLAVSPTGMLQRFTWINDSQVWNPFWYAPKDQCDNYKECGQFGNCDTNASPVCKCLKGFEPENPQAWSLRDGSDGCLRKTDLDCGSDKFLHLRDVKLPESTTSFVDRNMSLKECEAVCSRNCSCTGYSIADIRNGGSGCVTWVGELVDIRQYSAGGQDFYLRLAASDLEDGSNLVPAIIGTTVSIAVLLFIIGAWFLWKKNKAWRQWKDGKGLEIVDSVIEDTYPADEVMRCIQVGLLCVQERAEDRPTMASVVLMLSSDTATMRHPKTPGFCLGRSSNETDSCSSKQDGTFTINQVTVTMLDAR